MRLLTRKVKVRADYREISTAGMKHWGHNAFWWPEESRTSMCMFGSRPRVGDVVIADGTHYVVEKVDTPSNPGDQHFLTLRALKKPPRQSEHVPTWVDGLV